MPVRRRAADPDPAGTPIVDSFENPVTRVNLSGKGPKTVGLPKDRKVVIRDRVYQGDLCDLFEATYLDPKPPQQHVDGGDRFSRILEDDDEATEIPVLVKVCRNELDNDLVESEARNLGTLFPLTEKEDQFFRYLPRTYGAFRNNGLQCHIIGRVTGYVSLGAVLRAFPKGIDYRDLAWVFKRTLVGVGFAHQKGFIHGALLPEHVLVHPTDHGAKIIDWSYSVKTGRIRAMCADFNDYYAPEIPARRDATPMTDLYMIGKCMVALLSGDPKTNTMPDEVPLTFQAIIQKCLDPQPTMRAPDAWALHDELDQVLHALVGKPKYRPLVMP